MDTPWGPLKGLDSSDKQLIHQILSGDKDALIEGLVVENVLDQILEPLWAMGSASGQDDKAALLDVETVIAASAEGRIAFVWARTMLPGLGRYLHALERAMPVYLVTYADGTFFTQPIIAAKQQAPKRPLEQVIAELTGRTPTLKGTSRTVRDQARIDAAYWGFLNSVYKGDIWQRVVLPRILINVGIAPYFDHVWNIDRVCIYDGRPWAIEIKHKFPFGRRDLRFGINIGELRNVAGINTTGIGCLHTILVKPRWIKNEGSMYLFNQRELMSRVAVLAMDLGSEAAGLLKQGPRLLTGRSTSVHGESDMKAVTFTCDRMTCVGTLSDSNESLAAGLGRVLSGEKVHKASARYLESLRVTTEM